jgi:hypothetical protein
MSEDGVNHKHTEGTARERSSIIWKYSEAGAGIEMPNP